MNAKKIQVDECLNTDKRISMYVKDKVYLLGSCIEKFILRKSSCARSIVEEEIQNFLSEYAKFIIFKICLK